VATNRAKGGSASNLTTNRPLLTEMEYPAASEKKERKSDGAAARGRPTKDRIKTFDALFAAKRGSELDSLINTMHKFNWRLGKSNQYNNERRSRASNLSLLRNDTHNDNNMPYESDMGLKFMF
jgi:hypothetical protein